MHYVLSIYGICHFKAMKMQWNKNVLDLTILCLFVTLNIVDKSFQNRNHDRWEHISFRYGFWHDLPSYQSRAFKEGYSRKNDVCKTDNYHGFLFVKDGNTKAMPIYDLNGNLAGIQAAIPGNMRGYNSLNETIDLPPVEIMPPVLKGHRDSKGILYYTVTAYFKHPKLICSPKEMADVSPGRGLYIQMGFNPENDFLYIPNEAKHLSQLWKKGNCVPMMGTHYFMNLSQQLPCEKLYPVFLMYDMEGKLGAFGWVFQGKPNNLYSEDGMGWFHLTPVTYPFLYDTDMLPPCMMYDNFKVFGIHIYLQEPTKLLCTATADKSLSTKHPQTYSKSSNHHSDNFSPNQRKDRDETVIRATNIDINRDSQSENYAIDAYNKRINAGLYLVQNLAYICLLSTLTILLNPKLF